MESNIDENRIENRIAGVQQKQKTYARVHDYITISKKIVKNEYQNNQIVVDNLTSILKYLNSTTFSEIINFGQRFPFTKFLHFICENQGQEKGLLAFKVLAIASDSKEASENFFMKNELIDLCNHNILNPQYSTYVLKILNNGSDYEDFAKSLLSMNICYTLSGLPVTSELSMLVSNLSLYGEIKLQELLALIAYILDDQHKQFNNPLNDTVSLHIVCYAFKSLYHIFGNNQISPAIIQELKYQYYQFFVYFFPFLLSSDETRILNAIFRYLDHIDNIPPNFGFSIIRKFSNIEIIDKKNYKTIKLGMVIFDKNFEAWRVIPDLRDQLLSLIFSKFGDVTYNIKSFLLQIILKYYSFSADPSQHFLIPVINWCMVFIEDNEIVALALQQLIFIAKSTLQNNQINSFLCSNIAKFEELMVSVEHDETVVNLAAELVEILAADL